MLYELRAAYFRKESVIRFEETDDTEATYAAMFRVLNKARQSSLWALGEITLTNLTTNQILNQMGRK